MPDVGQEGIVAISRRCQYPKLTLEIIHSSVQPAKPIFISASPLDINSSHHRQARDQRLSLNASAYTDVMGTIDHARQCHTLRLDFRMLVPSTISHTQCFISQEVLVFANELGGIRYGFGSP